MRANRLRVGGIVTLIDNDFMSAQIGAKARITDMSEIAINKWIRVKWIDDVDTDLRRGQRDGEYFIYHFKAMK